MGNVDVLKKEALTYFMTLFKILANITREFKVFKSVHHRTIQINQQADATIFQFIILTFIYCSYWAPDDGRGNTRNMLSCK